MATAYVRQWSTIVDHGRLCSTMVDHSRPCFFFFRRTPRGERVLQCLTAPGQRIKSSKGRRSEGSHAVKARQLSGAKKRTKVNLAACW